MQFKISEDFNDIVIDKDIDYYQNMTEVHDYILKFIEEKCQNIVFYNIREQKYYDAEGFHLLDENFTCERCHKTYNKEKFQIVIDYKEFTSFVCFFVFEVKDGIPFLYIFKRKFQNKDDIYLKSTGISDLFQVTKKGLYQIFTKEYLSYESYNNYMNADSEEFDFEKWEAFDYFSSDYNFLDTESLEELKKTSVYQYTYIWKLKDYLKNKSISTSMITHLPLYYKEFEYLIKLGLYTLAIDYSFFITYKNNFKDTFGVEKKYYPLMKEMDISMDELELLRLYPTMDKEIIKMFSYHLRYTKEVLKYTSLDSLKDYFKKQNLESHNISEYIDYLKASEKLKLDLKPVLTVKARITSVKTIEKGETVGYGRIFRAEKKLKIATASIGFADGYPRNLSGKNVPVIINGKKAIVIGRICMDILMIDIKDIEVKVGDIVTLIGDKVTADLVADFARSASYELLCRLGTRLHRIYKYEKITE